METYLLWVCAVPVDTVSLRWSKPGADAPNEAHNPNQIHGGEQGRRAETEHNSGRLCTKKEKKKKTKSFPKEACPRTC